MRPNALLVLLAVLIGVACSSGTGGGAGGPGPNDSAVPQDSLTFLRPDSAAPPLADRVVGFWAVRGQNREIRLMYRPYSGQSDSVEFARFRVDNTSLVNDSAGHPIAIGDSILITLGVVDTLRLITEFHPSGLVFNPLKPARLWLKFGECDHDLNHDGVVNAADSTLLASLRIWKQEQPADPWSLVPSQTNFTSQEVTADILGFTRFAVAY
jgi:hypothetical protein